MLFLFLACLGISNPNTEGSASALMGTIQLELGALASFAVGVCVKNYMLPMVLIMTVSTILTLIILILGKRNVKKIL